MKKIIDLLKALGGFTKNNPAKCVAILIIGFALGATHNWLGL